MHNFKVELIPIFEDNYVFVLWNEFLKESIVIDPGDPLASQSFLQTKGLFLRAILLTHHHPDHIGGAQQLKDALPCPIYAPQKNKTQIPFADFYLQESDILQFEDLKLSVLELPGHTLGHIAFYNPQSKWLFSGDVLFGLGCGRLFEGTPEQMFQSLKKIKDLPPETLVYCTHEYTEKNLMFCKKLSQQDAPPIAGDNENLRLYESDLRNKQSLGLPSVPLKLSIEMKVNPFLLSQDIHQFTYLRDLRNKS
jgi:hydroxyacylglutathione hydrolase